MADETDLLGRQVFRNQDALERQLERLVKLETHFDHAPKPAHLDRLETRIMSAVDAKVLAIRDSLIAANREQSKDLMTEWRNLRTTDREAAAADQLASTQAILSAVKDRRSRWWWVAVGIVATIIGLVGSTLIIVWLLGRP